MTWNNAKLREKIKAKKGAKTTGTAADSREVDWQEIPGAEITSALEIICAAGGCLRLGTSRDRKTYSVGFYLGDTYFTEYYRTSDECRDFLAHMPEVVQMALKE